MLADYMAGFRALIEAIAIERLFLLGEPGAYQQLNCLGGDRLDSVNHAAIGKALIIPRHIVCGGFHARASTEWGQY